MSGIVLRLLRLLAVVAIVAECVPAAGAQSAPALSGVTHQGFASALQGDELYVVGGLLGFEGNNQRLTANYKIDLATGEPTTISTDVIFGDNNAAALWDGLIYVSGGSALVSHSIGRTGVYSTGFSRAFAAYDIARDAWVRLPDMPTTAYDHCSFASSGNVYVVGGQQQRPMRPFQSPYVTATRILRYSIADARWSWMDAPAGVLTQYAACTQLGHEYFLIGGRDDTAVSKAVWVWDFEANTWRRAPDLPYGMSGAEATTLDGAIYVVGGSVSADLDDVTDADKRRILVLRNGAQQWEPAGEVAAQRIGHAVVAWHSGIYAVGGIALEGPRPPGLWVERIH